MYTKTNDKYWLAFASIEQISSNFILELYLHFKDIQKAWNACLNDLVKIKNLRKSTVEKFLYFRDKTDPDKCLNYIKEKNIKYFHLESENYPELLKNIQKKPACIFYLGDMDRCCFNRTLAIVGSRKLSNNVSKVLKNIMEPLANSDICIISGLAQGADTFAHKYALENNLSTIAVLGSGFDKLYPIENKNLFSEIIEKYGVVMTEYWPTFEPIHWRFPLRNRIVTGLSYGTLIVEARLRSGAMISANLCLDEGRELMCIPGDLLNPNTEGIYKLLKSGATIVTCAEDILDTLNWQKTKMTYSEVKDLNLNDLEYNIYETIKMNSPSFDEIIYKTSCNADELMLHLTTLELKGLIRQVDGSKYIVN